MKRTAGISTAKALYNDFKHGNVNFELEIQRQAGQWDIHLKSLFILTVLQDYPVPNLHILQDGKVQSIIDGKQRLTTLFGFIDGDFKISSADKLNADDDTRVYFDTQDGETYDPEDFLGQEFDGLPKELRERIYKYEFSVNVYDRAHTTNDDIENVYRRINNGVPLASDQKLKAALGFDCLKEMSELTKHRFLKNAVNISKGQHAKDAEMSIIMQSLLLLGNEDITGSFLNKNMLEHGIRFRSLPDEEQKAALERVSEAFNYLESAFPTIMGGTIINKNDKKQLKDPLKKITIPNVVAMAYHAGAADVPASKFRDWFVKFFSGTTEVGMDGYNPTLANYQSFCKTSTAANNAVKGRYGAMKASFTDRFDITFEDFMTSAQRVKKEEDKKPSKPTADEPPDERQITIDPYASPDDDEE
ncbi:hypothetical protein FACS1894188_01480 [Clostridia bacterium]|nr:hypothetical protein FACS1894188_01480 [Clostridia bacterium]